ncbi:MAG: acyl-[acyl-carrier-protein]--UDP-N-acetylglucosamine O-acyltransferase, partial [Campylobacterales bacterium]|nr:acyl-[acyl-carrier-protein]--UDP-N-acetylglucosamine O-acyltransferase [Campylobacterales bacterium]
MSIHPTAIIEEGAIIGDGCVIEPNVFIGKDVKIGKNNFIGFSTYITGDVTIGDNNEIGQHGTIGTKPQSIAYNDEPTNVVIGSNNVIRENVEIHRGSHVEGYGTTSIGDNNFIMSSIHIGH